jgi:hypothetical protein
VSISAIGLKGRIPKIKIVFPMKSWIFTLFIKKLYVVLYDVIFNP